MKSVSVSGVVKWFDESKGYGFLTTINDDGTEGADCFVHFSDIIGKSGEFKTLHERDRVLYDIEKGPRGDKAKNVILN